MMSGTNTLSQFSAGMRGKASVIDLGSNSLKMINYNLDSNDSYKPYHQESVKVKLAEGLKDDIIPDNYIENTIEPLRLFRSMIDFEGIDYVIAFATSAVRDASNRNEFVDYIRRETGFDFKILSERQEALYSYTGAIHALKLPSVVFFDLGGGSLEIVVSQNFEIKKVLSLPLGSIRLTQQFSNEFEYSGKDIARMRSHILDYIPTRESLGLSDTDDVVLAGVGGTLRRIAKYHQDLTHYPLAKVHNYSMSYNLLQSISQYLLTMTPQEISKIESIGSGRAYMIQAGSLAISELVKRLDFSSLVVSAQGLCEGTLALSLQFPKDFASGLVDIGNVQDLTMASCRPKATFEYVEGLVNLLFSMKLLTDKERMLLAEAILQIDKLSSFRDVDNVLYTILDNDSALSHREQLIVALALIYSKKRHKADILISKYSQILIPSDKKTIKKISSVVSICDIFHKTRTPVKSRSDTPSSINLEAHASTNTFPETLLQKMCFRMENTLGISIKSRIYYTTANPSAALSRGNL